MNIPRNAESSSLQVFRNAEVEWSNYYRNELTFSGLDMSISIDRFETSPPSNFLLPLPLPIRPLLTTSFSFSLALRAFWDLPSSNNSSESPRLIRFPFLFSILGDKKKKRPPEFLRWSLFHRSINRRRSFGTIIKTAKGEWRGNHPEGSMASKSDRMVYFVIRT